MRVSKAVREYVRKFIYAKTKPALDKAIEAADAARKERTRQLDEIRGIIRSVHESAHERIVKELKKKGYTWVREACYYGRLDPKEPNLSFSVELDSDKDIVETAVNSYVKEKYPCKKRDEYDRIVHKPNEIEVKIDDTVQKFLFELELGKVAKDELDQALNNLEVDIS